MKLGKLLAAGKSIMNGRTDISYRSSKQIYLPKFGSARNPFKDGGPAEGAEKTSSSEPTVTAPGPRSSGGPTRLAPSDEPPVEQAPLPHCGIEAASRRGSDRPQEVKPSGSGLSKQQSVMVTAQSARSPRPAALPQQKKAKDGSKFNLLSILRAILPARKARRSENTAKGQKGTPTQTELSLDAVKVLHNDLSDVDVEIVPIKSRAATPELPAPKKSWEFVGERLFGVEAT